MKKWLLLPVFLVSFTIAYAQVNLKPQEEGSKVEFVIRNFGINTDGNFKGLEGNIRFNPDNILDWAFDVSVKSSTIDTDNRTRDTHLRKSAYFDVSTYPQIKLVSTKIESTDKSGIYQLTANLSIKDVTRQIKFNFKVNRFEGGYLFTGDFNINRRDFNVGSGSISLSDNVQINLNIFAK